MGGGGSDDSYERQQKATEAKKQAARDALNVIFGVAPTTAPTASSFTTRKVLPSTDSMGNTDWLTKTVTDSTGLDTANADYTASQSTAASNKAARDALYGKVREDAYTAGKRGIDETKTSAARNNKFALFAQGLNGGSEDIDQNALLERTYGQGLLDLGAKADAVKTGLAGNDEQTRLGLLQSIDAGMDQGSALSSALAQMKNSADKAASEATGLTLGDLFANSGLLYTKSNLARGRNAANDAWSSLFSTSPTMPRASGTGGIVTSTG